VRQNGLRASSFVAVVDVDPRVADQLLDLLRLADVAAYSEPAPWITGVYRDHQVPTRRLDRLFVDRSETGRAQEVLDRAVPHLQAELELVIRDGFAVDGEHRTLLDGDRRSLDAPPGVSTGAQDSRAREVVGEVGGFRPAVLADEAPGAVPHGGSPVPAGVGTLPAGGGSLSAAGAPLPTVGADAAAGARDGAADGPDGSGVDGPGGPGVDRPAASSGPAGSGVDEPGGSGIERSGAVAFEPSPSRPALVDGASGVGSGTTSGTITGVGVDGGVGGVGVGGAGGARADDGAASAGGAGPGAAGAPAGAGPQPVAADGAAGAPAQDPGRFAAELDGPGVHPASTRSTASGPGSAGAPAGAAGAPAAGLPDAAGLPEAAGRAATGGPASVGGPAKAAAGPLGPPPGPGPTSTAGRHAGGRSDDLDDAAVDAAWARIVADFDTPADGDAPWPPTEDVTAGRTTRLRRATRPPSSESAPTAVEVDHFVPPPPPQLPRLDTLTRLGWAALVAGPVLLVLVVVFGRALPGWLPLLGVLTLVGGFALLVSRLRPRDSDDDSDHHDGAVV